MGNHSQSQHQDQHNKQPTKMLRLTVLMALALISLSSALPVTQQAAAAGATGQGDQRIFGNLLGAIQGAWQGLTRPEQLNNNFGFGYPLTTNHLNGGFGGAHNQGGWNVDMVADIMLDLDMDITNGDKYTNDCYSHFRNLVPNF